MEQSIKRLLEERTLPDHLQKLEDLDNAELDQFVGDAVALCEPDSLFVCTDAPEDISAVRRMALEKGEEEPLATQGHTVHFDAYHDQARDRRNTRYLVAPEHKLGDRLNQIDRDEGLREVRKILKGSMRGRQMLVRFFSLGPTHSEFSISGVQLTDSAYVAHSEDILYRPGYEQFKRLAGSGEFFRMLHSSGRHMHGVSADTDKRRVYIDLEKNTVYSTNTQYAGNTVGFKKLSLRLAIRKADREGWLAEHMFAMGVHGPRERKTYFVGAFPSGCGKTSTAMLAGESIVGDDLAYLRRKGGAIRAVNVESGIFGIIGSVNEENDRVIWDVLTKPAELIFSNVLVNDGKPYWLDDGREPPKTGVNHSYDWWEGKRDPDGKNIPLAHPNARFTIRLTELSNLDEGWDDPEGVPVGGIVYGGRDPDTSVPVQQAFDWAHGVVSMGGSLESTPTKTVLDHSAKRAFQPMSNLDFISLPLGRYISNHLSFVDGLENPPLIFAANYFLADEHGKYLNGMYDKGVWMKWMEQRCHGDVPAIETPTGLVPRHEDLEPLFKQVLGKAYSKDDYVKQFSLRVPQNLDKIERITDIYRTQVDDAPDVVFDVLDAQKQRLLKAREKGGDLISPFDFA